MIEQVPVSVTVTERACGLSPLAKTAFQALDCPCTKQ